MRVVLDTNVIIAGVISTGLCHDLLRKGFRGEFEMLGSVETIDELRETLLKYPERFHMSPEEVEQEVETVQYFTTFIEPTEEINEIDADPDDDKFLEVATAGDADWIVSGDSHLLDLESFRAIDIIEPRTAYDLLEEM